MEERKPVIRVPLGPQTFRTVGCEEPTPMIPQDPEIDWDAPDVHPTVPEQPEPARINNPKEENENAE